MNKKSLPAADLEEEAWQEGDEPDVQEKTLADPEAVKPGQKQVQGKPSRQRIEEYFERKRLAEALQEDLDEDIFKDL